MGTGAITGYFDVAQIALYGFWIFFAGLIYYLHRENKREGYPLESDRSANVKVEGFPSVPRPRTYLLRGGERIDIPNPARDRRGVPPNSRPTSNHLGAPIEPVGDPMLAGIGPGAWSERADVPDLTLNNDVKIVPLRLEPQFSVNLNDPDPRGYPVVGADGQPGGIVRDIWVDRSESVFRYLEVELPAAPATISRRVLLPMNFSRFRRGKVTVRAILGRQFAQVPTTRSPNQVTFLEEDKIMAFYGAGTLYATPSRQEPLL